MLLPSKLTNERRRGHILLAFSTLLPFLTYGLFSLTPIERTKTLILFSGFRLIRAQFLPRCPRFHATTYIYFLRLLPSSLSLLFPLRHEAKNPRSPKKVNSTVMVGSSRFPQRRLFKHAPPRSSVLSGLMLIIFSHHLLRRLPAFVQRLVATPQHLAAEYDWTPKTANKLSTRITRTNLT